MNTQEGGLSSINSNRSPLRGEGGGGLRRWISSGPSPGACLARRVDMPAGANQLAGSGALTGRSCNSLLAPSGLLKESPCPVRCRGLPCQMIPDLAG